MAKPHLRAVRNDEKPDAKVAWLASYRREQEALAVIAKERTLRPSLKREVMAAMNLWGMTDIMLAAEVERANAR